MSKALWFAVLVIFCFVTPAVADDISGFAVQKIIDAGRVTVPACGNLDELMMPAEQFGAAAHEWAARQQCVMARYGEDEFVLVEFVHAVAALIEENPSQIRRSLGLHDLRPATLEEMLVWANSVPAQKAVRGVYNEWHDVAVATIDHDIPWRLANTHFKVAAAYFLWKFDDEKKEIPPVRSFGVDWTNSVMLGYPAKGYVLAVRSGLFGEFSKKK